MFKWLRNGAGAGILANLAAGRLAAAREALDCHQRRGRRLPAANAHAGGAFPPRDEELARIERWLADLLASS